MASLANQTISSSYDGLIKTATDDAVAASGIEVLQDGSGNELSLSVGRTDEGASITGSVGINTASPQTELDVFSGTGDKSILRLTNTQVGTEEAFLDGDVISEIQTYGKGFGGIGERVVSSIVTETGSAGTSPSAEMVFNISDADSNIQEVLRLDRFGNVKIGGVENAASGVGFQMFAGGFFYMNAAGTGNTGQIRFYRNTNVLVGQIRTNGTSTSYLTSSDYRLKENVVEMTDALDRVDALKPSRFNFISDPSVVVDGFIAHEVAEVVPEAVSGYKDELNEDGEPEYQGIDQSKIVPLLVGAIQELRKEVEALKSIVQ